jgi:glycosyltransferase involved in cell wall biosynthesis
VAIRVLGLLSHSQMLDEYRTVHGVDYARVINPLRYLPENLFKVSLRLNPFRHDPTIRDDNPLGYLDWQTLMMDYDVVLYSYTVVTDWYVMVAFHAMKAGVKLICDIDDNVWEVPKRSGAYESFHRGAEDLATVEAQLRNQQYIMTTQQKTAYAIADHAGLDKGSIFKYPNYIDLSVYNPDKINRVDDGKIRICYFGTNTHFDDLAENRGFLGGMDRIMREHPNVEFFTIGFYLHELKVRWKKQYFSMTGDRDVYSWANNLWVKIMNMSDIAVCPLLVDNFTRSKSNIKYLECAAGKKPVVAQKIDQYQATIQHGYDGFLAETEEEWYKSLKDLVVDKEYRQQIGETALLTIKSKHQIQNNTLPMQMYLEKMMGVI